MDELKAKQLECRAYQSGGITKADLDGVDTETVAEVARQLIAVSQQIRSAQ